jgi:hypothetical protein
VYKSINHEKVAYLEEAKPYCAKVVGILTGGGGLSAVGEAVAQQYGKPVGKDQWDIESNPFGHELFRNILKFEQLYFEETASRIVADIEAGLGAEPPDTEKVNGAATEGRELLLRLENEAKDDGLYFLLGWMVDKLDGGQPGDDSARKIIRSHREFNLLFFTIVRLLNALVDTMADPYSGDGRVALEDALKQYPVAMRAVTRDYGEDGPTPLDVRRQISAILSKINDPIELARWGEVLRLMAELEKKSRRLAEITGEGPQKEKVDELAWGPSDNALGHDQREVVIQASDRAGYDIPWTFQIFDPDKIMIEAGLRLPVVKSFKLQETGFTGQLYCFDAPSGGLRVVLYEAKVLREDGTVKHKFDTPAKQTYDVQAGEWIAPFEWAAEFDSWQQAPEEKGKLKILVTLKVLQVD